MSAGAAYDSRVLLFLRVFDLGMTAVLVFGALMVYHGITAALRREYRYDAAAESASLISILANLAIGSALLALAAWYFGSGREAMIGLP